MTEHVFVLGDGDKVRDRLDSLLFSGQLDELKRLSTAISQAIVSVANDVIAKMGGEIVVAGGDDLLLRVPAESFTPAVLEALRRSFQLQTGCSLSIGAAQDVDRAYINLRRAKARGGDALIAS